MNKQEFVEKLREHGAWCTECHDINGKKDRYVKSAKVRELLEQLDEPQAEKLEVPGFVGNWYESNKHKIERAIIDVACSMEKGEFPFNLPFEDWFIDPGNHPIETLIKMKLNGYTVKSKRWVVKNEKGYVAMENFKDFDNHKIGVKFTIVSEKSEAAYWDDIDRAKAEAVAILVEGTVEEV